MCARTTGTNAGAPAMKQTAVSVIVAVVATMSDETGNDERSKQGTDDIVTRLRETEGPDTCWGCGEWGCVNACDCICHAWTQIVTDAADEIEWLRADNEYLTARISNMVILWTELKEEASRG